MTLGQLKEAIAQIPVVPDEAEIFIEYDRTDSTATDTLRIMRVEHNRLIASDSLDPYDELNIFVCD